MRIVESRARGCVTALALFVLVASGGCAIRRDAPLDVAQLAPIGVRLDAVDHDGRAAVRVVEDPSARGSDALAVLTGSDFADGTIEVDVAAAPGPSASPTARGFVGVAFRIQSAGAQDGVGPFEAIYLRPTNGRADDQLRRNHSTQYIASPEYPWERLREETPGQYESYVDLVPDAWTRMRIVVDGTHARLFIGDAEQPCLIVNDLKHGASRGTVGLWIGSGTVAYFANLRVTPAGAR